jgi:hypothetical protein
VSRILNKTWFYLRFGFSRKLQRTGLPERFPLVIPKPQSNAFFILDVLRLKEVSVFSQNVTIFEKGRLEVFLRVQDFGVPSDVPNNLVDVGFVTPSYCGSESRGFFSCPAFMRYTAAKIPVCSAQATPDTHPNQGRNTLLGVWTVRM